MLDALHPGDDNQIEDWAFFVILLDFMLGFLGQAAHRLANLAAGPTAQLLHRLLDALDLHLRSRPGTCRAGRNSPTPQGDGDMRGPWNQGEHWDFVDDRAKQAAVDGGDGSASVKQTKVRLNGIKGYFKRLLVRDLPRHQETERILHIGIVALTRR
jgi:hypothetical protein